MKAVISVFGRFHAFNLAQQLQQQKHLHQLISTYPKFAAARYGIDPGSVCSLWKLELLARIQQRSPTWIWGNYNTQLWFLEQFDRAVVRELWSETDLFIGWSGACFWSLQRAKELGALTVVERGSSHMAHQTQVLQEEYKCWGLQFAATHPGVYERELQSYQIADRIAIPSFYAKQTFIKQGVPENKLIHVAYGTSLKEFYPVCKEDQVFRVIHCGSINLRKGVQYVLQAFYELQLPDAELWLVGTVSPEIQPFLKKYQSDRIVLKGKQPQRQLRWFYSQCSVFCLASIEEGLAMVQAQAMACGLPVIHTPNTGGEDIIKNGKEGFCIPIRDVEALKEKILFFYENPDQQVEMGKKSLAQAQQFLSWNEYGKKIVAAYHTALAIP